MRVHPLVFSALLICAGCGSDSGAADREAGAQPGLPAPATPAPNAAPSIEEGLEAMTSPTPAGSEAVSVDQLAPSPGSPISGASGDGAPPQRAPAQPSAGCGQPAALAGGAQSVLVSGAARTFLLDLPPGYEPDVAYPLVFGFHGATTSAAFFRSARYGNLLSTLGDIAIVVHADALGNPTAWNNAADIPFFDAMLELLEQSLCVDRARVFATGHSSGGFFSNALGCQRGDVLRAIAPVAGGGPFGGARCTGEVAVWLAHGENDMTVPFATGEASRDGWLQRNGCELSTAPLNGSADCVGYDGCGAGLPVRWCVHQNGHNWPSFAPQAIRDFVTSL